MKVAILTDTNSGISTQEAEKLGIFVMPMPVIIDDEVFFEGQNISEEQFYEALQSDRKVSTSQPSPGDLLDQWDEILKDYDQLVYIPMSSGLSNSCMAATGLALDYEGKVFVADNHRISVTLRNSVLAARKLADQSADASQIKDFLEKEAYHSIIYLAVNTLDFLKKGGRITPAAAMLGSVLNIKPILTIQGEKLDSFAKVRGNMKKCELKMLEALQADFLKRFPDTPEAHLQIGLAGAGLSEAEIDEWAKIIRGGFPSAQIYYNPLSASIACHTGPGAVGIGMSADSI